MSDALPLPDYDDLPLGSLQHRVRTLDADGVRALISYEEEHGDRLPVLTVLRARLDQLESGATPSGGDPAGLRPEVADEPAAGSKVREEGRGPVINPPSQGVPTNPSQPRTWAPDQ